MVKAFNFGKLITFILSFSLIFLLIFHLNYKELNAIEMHNINEESATEELRLNVPYEYKDFWLKLEKEVWEPWLSNQEGFLGRQIFYNVESGEALLLVDWKSKKLWKNISKEEVDKVQEVFDEKIKNHFEINTNPIKLVFEGELIREK